MNTMNTVNTAKSYSLAEAADVVQLSPEVLRRYIRKGQLKAAKGSKGYRITIEDLFKLVNGYERKREG